MAVEDEDLAGPVGDFVVSRRADDDVVEAVPIQVAGVGGNHVDAVLADGAIDGEALSRREMIEVDRAEPAFTPVDQVGDAPTAEHFVGDRAGRR